VFYTYTGQEDDDDLGFYNYVARLYDPGLGRFISPDIIVPNIQDPQALNRYSYARNNPIFYVDPDGKALAPWHGIITYLAALNSGYYTLGQSYALGWNAMMVDFSASEVTGGWSCFSPYAVDTVRHGMGGWIPEAGRWQNYAETQRGTEASASIRENNLPFAFHARQDWAVHKGESMEEYGLFKNPLYFIWHNVRDILPLGSLGEMYKGTLEVIEQAHQWAWYGRSVDFGSRYSLDIGNPMSSLLTIGSTSKEPIFTSNWSLDYRPPTNSYSGSLRYYSGADLGSERVRLNLNPDLDWYNSYLGGL
jgi:RHS repeat-associated protein